MPLEVNEIGIVIRVEGADRAEITEPSAQHQLVWREKLIDECVRRVLEVLKMEREP